MKLLVVTQFFIITALSTGMDRSCGGISYIFYRTDKGIIVADYKTDQVKIEYVTAKAAKYQYQKEVYTEAVRRCLNINNPEFKLIFLRLGKGVVV